ncbi:hypothetical protein cypCar_00039373 [Cyprinus carpio]|nr:hypothetical protein cypCar_00039373 [Cyprinus carpio]
MARSLNLFGLLLYTSGTLSMKTLDHVTLSESGSITIPCLYDSQYKPNSKYWCEGYFWNSCQITAHTNAPGKWTITDFPANNIFTVKLNKLTSSDSGYYWCAVKIGTYANPDDRKYLYVTVKSGALIRKREPDVYSVAEGPLTVAYDTVVFKKAEDCEQNQVSISRPPERDEVVYSTPRLQ